MKLLFLLSNLYSSCKIVKSSWSICLSNIYLFMYIYIYLLFINTHLFRIKAIKNRAWHLIQKGINFVKEHQITIVQLRLICFPLETKPWKPLMNASISRQTLLKIWPRHLIMVTTWTYRTSFIHGIVIEEKTSPHTGTKALCQSLQEHRPLNIILCSCKPWMTPWRSFYVVLRKTVIVTYCWAIMKFFIKKLFEFEYWILTFFIFTISVLWV